MRLSVNDVAPVALEGRGLSKRYGATRALQDISIRLRRGNVTTLAGGNGAGKSTLIRLLTGVEHPDKGDILRDGSPVRLSSRMEATKAGVFCVFQDQPFVSTFPVYRQVYLGYEDRFRRRGFASDQSMHRSCQQLFEELGLHRISSSQLMGKLSTAAREVVAIASVSAVSRVLDVEHPVILLDEPTSALSVEELDFLRQFIESLRQRSALLFVSHRLTEVMSWSDEMYVLRDGRNVDHMTRETLTRDRVHRAMSGRDDDAAEADDADRAEVDAAQRRLPGDASVQDPLLSRFFVAGLHLRKGDPGYDFRIRGGEVVGLAGVEGSGKEEFLRACAGVADPQTLPANVRVDGREIRGGLRGLLRAGVVYVSGDRQGEGLLANLSIVENFSIGKRAVSGPTAFLVRRSVERTRAQKLVSTLAVKVADVNAPIQTLSGGNQQKVLLGRSLELAPRVLLLDNVTRGVDVGAKEGIYSLLHSLVQDGLAVVLASDDLEELARVADRIVVFKDGYPHEELQNTDRNIPQADILRAML